ncbi:MAG: Uma2 family endonuclease [Gemmatimonas sp.]|uniref:Uma2 family endonuclease n=1 Tax=Gemmatimonas sp. TaxID=1962908 RepID=UPI00391F1F7B
MTALPPPSATVAHAVLPTVPSAEHMMGMPAVEQRRWTAAEVQALPEEPGKRFECVDGELLVSPSPSRAHQIALALLMTALTDYARRDNRALVLPAPHDYVLDPFTVVQPDITVVPTPAGRAPRRDEECEPPVLFVEVLSPSTARYDRVVKRSRYQREGVAYWIVDVEARLIERWTADERPEVLTERLTWRLSGHPDEFLLEVPEYFARVHGEA